MAEESAHGAQVLSMLKKIIFLTHISFPKDYRFLLRVFYNASLKKQTALYIKQASLTLIINLRCKFAYQMIQSQFC